jgi:hypothetical protein
MTELTQRKAVIEISWQSIEAAMRRTLGRAMTNLDGMDAGYRPAEHLTVTIDGRMHRDWEIARMIVGRGSVEEVLLVRKQTNHRGSDIGAEYIIFIMGDQAQFGGYPLPVVAHVAHADDGFLHCMAPSADLWEKEWDEVLIKLRRQYIRYEEQYG